MKTIAQNEERRQPKIKTEMSGKGLTVHAGLLPVLTFMGKLLFRQRVQEAVRKERGGKCTVSDGWWCANGSRGIDSGSDLDGAGSEGVVG